MSNCTLKLLSEIVENNEFLLTIIEGKITLSHNHSPFYINRQWETIEELEEMLNQCLTDIQLFKYSKQPKRRVST